MDSLLGDGLELVASLTVFRFCKGYAGLILRGGNEGDCLHAPWSLLRCPSNAQVEIYNFLFIGPGAPFLKFSEDVKTLVRSSLSSLCLPRCMKSVNDLHFLSCLLDKLKAVETIGYYSK